MHFPLSGWGGGSFQVENPSAPVPNAANVANTQPGANAETGAPMSQPGVAAVHPPKLLTSVMNLSNGVLRTETGRMYLPIRWRSKLSLCPKKPRRRRTYAELNRDFVCAYNRCTRKYATLHSLNQHTKRKHPGFIQPQSAVSGVLSSSNRPEDEQFEFSDESDDGEGDSGGKWAHQAGNNDSYTTLDSFGGNWDDTGSCRTSADSVGGSMAMNSQGNSSFDPLTFQFEVNVKEENTVGMDIDGMAMERNIPEPVVGNLGFGGPMQNSAPRGRFASEVPQLPTVYAEDCMDIPEIENALKCGGALSALKGSRDSFGGFFRSARHTPSYDLIYNDLRNATGSSNLVC
eukprot:comp20296_c0_seq1/m.25484 comp20296_c0_seq1/g.25484  ORF comp20296_c0_seq1/g.25484 comp20296_c0_seq1/m.25484 type:complete len:345 (-) comp20296_c0_seq1:144-1178(-)